MMPPMKSRELLLTTAKFRVTRLRFEGPDGKEIIRDLVEHPGAAVILPVLDDGRIAMIRNLRRTVGKALWELPAGTLEGDEREPTRKGRPIVGRQGGVNAD